LSNAGLQAWEARTNQQTYSAVNTTGWSTNNATLNGASAVSPDGTTNAATITDNAASGIHGIYQQSQAVTASQTQTSSIFLKQGTIRYAEFLCYDTSGNGVVIFVDTQLGVLSGSGTIGAGATYVSSKIEPYANRWWRVSLVGTMTADTHLFQDVRMSPDGSTTFYAPSVRFGLLNGGVGDAGCADCIRHQSGRSHNWRRVDSQPIRAVS
jgi:hypothetical protein